MKRHALLMTLVLVVLTFFSCKEPKEFIDGLTITPNPIEYKNGKVEVTIEGTYPEKYFTKKLQLEITPVLKSETGEVVARGIAKTYVGQKIDSNAKQVAYKLGGAYSQIATFDYTPELANTDLWLEIKATSGKKEYSMPDEKIADGVNITPLLVNVKGTPSETDNGASDLKSVVAADKFQRIIEEKEDARILYLINQSNVRRSQLKDDDMVALTKAIKSVKDAQNREIKSMNISSYASPDGKMELNEKLSDRRSKASEKIVNRELKRIKSDVQVSSKFTAEDWAGFQELVENSNLEDKKVILRVLQTYTDPEEREREIKNLATVFKTLSDDILPQLRRSKLELTVNVIGRSDEEIAALAKADTTVLSVEEMLYAATLTHNNNEKVAIYSKAIAQFPNDFRGYNNLGMAQYSLGNLAEASKNFDKAYQMNAENASVNFNKGLIALSLGQDSQAEEFFGKSTGIGTELNLAKGALNIRLGHYKEAVNLFNEAPVNNAALASILNKDYANAQSILNNVVAKDGTTYYMLAIVAARQNDAEGLVTMLAKAIQADAAWKAYATSDVEFLDFYENETFKVLVK